MGGPKVKYMPLWNAEIISQAIQESLVKLTPWHLAKTPILLLVEIGFAWTFMLWFRDLLWPTPMAQPQWFTGLVSMSLGFTVLCATFAESLAEVRGRAQAETLRRVRKESTARRIVEGREEVVPASALRRDDTVLVKPKEMIPGDGEVIDGLALVDESAVTGESASVIRESGGDRSAVTGGTTVLSHPLLIRITAEPGSSFLDRMITLVEGRVRRRTPNEVALQVLLTGLTLALLVVCLTLVPMAGALGSRIPSTLIVTLAVCLIPTTIGALLTAIGISGMERVLRKNVLAMSGRAVEAAGDINVLVLDKTGTITLGNRMATELIPVTGVCVEELAHAAYLASAADTTPEGRSIVTLVETQWFQLIQSVSFATCRFIPFSAHTRLSGSEVDDLVFRKGAVDAVAAHVRSLGGSMPEEMTTLADRIGDEGHTPLAVACGNRVLGVIRLKDVLKSGIRDRMARFRAQGIRTVMVTGDNRRTAAMIAAEAGVDGFVAEATPETKMELIRQEQAQGSLVAVTGDGINDAPALAQADIGMAMNTGTQAAKEAANMIDLDSDPTKLLEIIEIGKQLLITRGSLTAFSLATDIGKYFAILPAMLAATIPAIRPLDIMHLASPQSAILSAVLFNAGIIVLLIPLALHGVRYRVMGTSALLRRQLLIYGLGGIVAPFLGIKLVDTVLVTLGLS